MSAIIAKFSHNATMKDDSESPKDVHFRDVAPAIEFACWVVVLLAPLLRLVNGPAVTSDQFVIQIAVFSLALVGAVGLRLYQFFRS
jgi:hypothetical protein